VWTSSSVVAWLEVEWAVRRVEAASNTSTVALRVVESDEKGTECLEV
jgi:hypothetical protein